MALNSICVTVEVVLEAGLGVKLLKSHSPFDRYPLLSPQSSTITHVKAVKNMYTASSYAIRLQLVHIFCLNIMLLSNLLFCLYFKEPVVLISHFKWISSMFIKTALFKSCFTLRLLVHCLFYDRSCQHVFFVIRNHVFTCFVMLAT